MKSLWLTLFCTLFILNINAQLSGTWLGDWQNAGLQQCQPSSLVITSINSTASSIQINFSPSNIQLCSSNPTFNVTGNYTDTITSTGGVWTDSKQYTLTLNGNVLSYQYGGSGQVNLLYSATGAIFSQQDSLGGIGGLWITPTPLPNANTSGCCVPDTVYLTLADGQNRLNSLFSYTSTNCSANTSFSTRFAILAPSSSSLVWTATSTEEQGPYSIDFVPNATLAAATLVWNSASCEIFYSRSPAINLNNTWENDWQTSPNSDLVNVTSYQITSVTSLNTTYMISSNTNNGTVTNSYVVETPQGSYYDAFFNDGNGVTFDYNAPTQTLMDSSDELLLSLNGSVLTNAPFLGSWSTAVALSNTSLPEGCCVPSQINISAIGSGESPLSVDYQLPSDYNNYIGCRDLATAVDSSNVISSTLLLSEPPSVSQLTWYDNSFNNIIFTVSNEKLVVQNMTLGCGFTMSIPVSPIPGPTPTPEPLAGSVVSSGIILLVIGLFMLAF